MQLDKPREFPMEALPRTESPAIGALAEHLGIPTEDMHAWVRQPAGVPSAVLLSWSGLWNVARLKG
jgi:hypothetical protein